MNKERPNSAGIDLAAELHCNPVIALQHHVRRNEIVNPAKAGYLEEAFGLVS